MDSGNNIGGDLLGAGFPKARERMPPVKSGLLAFLILLPIGSVQAAETFKIEGKVRDPKNSLVAGAAVTLVQPSGQFRRQSRTDDSGSYAISNVPAGDYQLIAQAAAGAAAQPVQVKSKNLVIDLKLGPRSAPEAPPSSQPMENSEPFQELNFNLAGSSAPQASETPMQPNPESVTVIRSGV